MRHTYSNDPGSYYRPSGGDCGCGGAPAAQPGHVQQPGPWPPGPGLYPPGPWPHPVSGPGNTGASYGASYSTVVIDGGPTFPYATHAYSVLWQPGLTAAAALAGTNAVRFTAGGGIAAVNGIRTGDEVRCVLRINGRQIPLGMLPSPIQAGDTVTLELLYAGT